MASKTTVGKSLAHLLSPYRDVKDRPSVMVTGLSQDSRRLQPGTVFAACAGTQRHGLCFAEQAEKAGAAAIIWEPDGQIDYQGHLPAVAVPHLSQRLGAIAARLYDQPSRQMLTTGITGTDGKTSCAWLIAQAWQALGRPCGYLGTLGFGPLNRLAAASHTTPDAVDLPYWLADLLAQGHETVALEISSHALTQHRTAALDLDVAVLTQVGRDHLDYHGSLQAYAAAKRRLFVESGARTVVLNADDAHGQQWLAEPRTGTARWAYGRGDAVLAYPHHVHIQQLVTRGSGLTVHLATPQGVAVIDSCLVGHFNAWNLAAALAVLLSQGVGLSQAAAALEQLPSVPGRMERLDQQAGQPLVVVDYAHTPGALKAALQALSAHAMGRLLCVFGCGGDRDAGKRAPMGAAVAQHAHQFWITDDNPRTEEPAAIVADIIQGVPESARSSSRCCIVHSRQAAIAAAIETATAEDVILIAGKGHETTQQYGSEVQPFDDRAVARQVLEEH